jgi:hypothetical protein
VTVAEVDHRLEGLRTVCSKPEFLTDAGREYIYLPQLKVTTDGRIVTMDALLRAGEHSGYPTRLFLAQALPGKGQGGGWSAHTICGRTWHTWSWKGVPENLPLLHILLGHLWALR